MKEKIIVALDRSNPHELDLLIENLSGVASFVKVGMEAYYAHGTALIQKLKKKNFHIFLDLKMHDIPTTVARTSAFLSDLGVDIINLHASGGEEMMKAAKKAISSHTKLIAVTKLTSTLEVNAASHSLSLARQAYQCELDGVVASALDAPQIKEIASNFLVISPGIRPQGTETHDQKRSATPKQAIELGSDYLVIGRPITQNKNPPLAFQNILKEII